MIQHILLHVVLDDALLRTMIFLDSPAAPIGIVQLESVSQSKKSEDEY